MICEHRLRLAFRQTPVLYTERLNSYNPSVWKGICNALDKGQTCEE